MEQAGLRTVVEKERGYAVEQAFALTLQLDIEAFGAGEGELRAQALRDEEARPIVMPLIVLGRATDEIVARPAEVLAGVVVQGGQRLGEARPVRGRLQGCQCEVLEDQEGVRARGSAGEYRGRAQTGAGGDRGEAGDFGFEHE